MRGRVSNKRDADVGGTLRRCAADAVARCIGLLCIGACWISSLATPVAMAQSGPINLEPDALRKIAKEAWVFTFPAYEMYRTRYEALVEAPFFYRSSINRFIHARKLSDESSRRVTTPNNDTLYSSAWLDLAPEPLVLSVPEMAGRYYSFAFMDFYTNNFASVGRRVTGTGPGRFVVAGPAWKGTAPQGLPVIKSPTNDVWLLARTLVSGEADLSTVHKLQDEYTLTPLSKVTGTPAPPSHKVSLEASDPKDPLNFFVIADLALTENPPPASAAPLLDEFAKIGVGPGLTFDPARFTPEQRALVASAIQEASQELRRPRAGGKVMNGWAYPPAQLGNYGDNYVLRAAVALMGLGALEPAEAIYLTSYTDSDGKPLSGDHRYRLRFEKGALPPAGAFWSLSMYEAMPDGRAYFTANPIGRYSVGDRTPGLKLGSDGSLEIVIAHASPGKDAESNWLPAPAGRFRLTLRAYQPREALLKGTYTMPGVARVE